MAPFTYGKGPQGGGSANEQTNLQRPQKRRKTRRERREDTKQLIIDRELDLTFVAITKRNGQKTEGRLRLVPHRDKEGQYRDKVFVETGGTEVEIDTGDIESIEELF